MNYFFPPTTLAEWWHNTSVEVHYWLFDDVGRFWAIVWLIICTITVLFVRAHNKEVKS